MMNLNMFNPIPPTPIPIILPSQGGGSGGAGGSKRKKEIEERHKQLLIEDDTILQIIKMFLQCQG